MGYSNVFLDLYSYIESIMAPAIAKHGLKLNKGTGDLVTLENDNMVAEFENVENDYVRFNFFSKAHPQERFEFADFLDAKFDERSRELRPLPPSDWADEDKFRYFLEAFNRLMVDGYFDAPIQGDFQWSDRYHELETEYTAFSKALSQLIRTDHPEADAIFAKKDDGDPTWKADLRRIMAEQEAKP